MFRLVSWSSAQRFRLGSLHSSAVDSNVLAIIRSGYLADFTSLNRLVRQHDLNAGIAIGNSLAYEPAPPPNRRIDFALDDSNVVMLSHVVDLGENHKVTFCSGFAVQPNNDTGSSLIVSCAHTLEQMRHSPLMAESAIQSAALIFHQHRGSLTANPVAQVLASRPRSDIILFGASVPSLRTLPLSPYPAPPGTRVRIHLVSESPGAESGWRPWIHGTWCKWAQGKVLGYRDFSGNNAEPGTYDSLSHLLFDPPPSPGSSGGPIVAEDTGSVVGVVLGSGMYNRVEGVRGWGVPSEIIYEAARSRVVMRLRRTNGKKARALVV